MIRQLLSCWNLYMNSRPIMVVSLCVPPEKEAEFNAFYHHSFLAAMLADCPEIKSIRRYEELGTSGTLRWYDKQFLTIYELESDEIVSKVDELFNRSSLTDVMREFKQWKSNHLRNFQRSTYKATWAHDRIPPDGPFGSRPFLLFSAEMKPEFEEEWTQWYQDSYLPLQVADIPMWSACRRYLSVDREQQRHLTFFEATDEYTLGRCMADLRAPHRVSANYEWHRRFEKASLWHSTTSFRCIYRRPG